MDSSKTLIISVIEKADIPEVAILYSLAFHDNPCYCSTFPNFADEEKYRAFKWFFQKRSSIALSLNWVMLKVTDDSGKIVGACCAVPPGHDSSLFDNIQHGILLWPYYWGMNSFNALLHLMKLTKPHDGGWELSMMAVHPDRQGKGIGHILLKHVLASIKERYEQHQLQQNENEKIVIYLSTQREQNVTFYEKAGGFGLLNKERFTYYHLPEVEYPSWTMKLSIPAELR